MNTNQGQCGSCHANGNNLMAIDNNPAVMEEKLVAQPWAFYIESIKANGTRTIVVADDKLNYFGNIAQHPKYSVQNVNGQPQPNPVFTQNMANLAAFRDLVVDRSLAGQCNTGPGSVAIDLPDDSTDTGGDDGGCAAAGAGTASGLLFAMFGLGLAFIRRRERRSHRTRCI
jgi:MYXO-CTERM domain-containing protein